MEESKSFEYTGSTELQLDYDGKAKILLPGQSYKLVPNAYIEGLIAQGILVEKQQPQTDKK